MIKIFKKNNFCTFKHFCYLFFSRFFKPKPKTWLVTVENDKQIHCTRGSYHVWVKGFSPLNARSKHVWVANCHCISGSDKWEYIRICCVLVLWGYFCSIFSVFTKLPPTKIIQPAKGGNNIFFIPSRTYLLNIFQGM